MPRQSLRWRRREIERFSGLGLRSRRSQASAATTSIVERGIIGRRAWLSGLSAVAFTLVPRRGMAAHPGTSRQVDGLVIYFVVVPSAFVLGHPAEHTGRGLHDAAPEGRYVHHLLVALFDSAKGTRVTDASVTAVIQGGRQTSPSRTKFELMTIGDTQIYGGFARLPPRDRYSIEVEVVRPGAGTIRTVFSHQHLQP